jgi:hypothetical protein
MKLPFMRRFEIDYDGPGIPDMIKRIRPTAFIKYDPTHHDHDTLGEVFCILSGDDIDTGILGTGAVLEEAIVNWQYAVLTRIASAPDNDPLANTLKKSLETA